LIFTDGLTHIFGTIKVTPDIRHLPDNYKAVIEWGRISLVSILRLIKEILGLITMGCNSLASTIFHMFIASDDASETFAGLKRIHGLMPYFMLKTALKITNPVSMIRSSFFILSTREPFNHIGCRRIGSVSRPAIWRPKFVATVEFFELCGWQLTYYYYSRMFTSSLTEEVKALEEEIEAVKNKVDDPIMCAKIRQFIYAPRDIQNMFKEDAG